MFATSVDNPLQSTCNDVHHSQLERKIEPWSHTDGNDVLLLRLRDRPAYQRPKTDQN